MKKRSWFRLTPNQTARERLMKLPPHLLQDIGVGMNDLSEQGLSGPISQDMASSAAIRAVENQMRRASLGV